MTTALHRTLCVLALPLGLALAGCPDNDRDLGDEIEDLGEDIGDKAEDVGDKVEDAVD
jgi:hypothetical protein